MKKQKIRRKENKKMAKNLKKNIKGITLIAFVVTIIVLLILASVAISLTIGNNGIFTRAGNATDKWQEASKNEENEMNKASNFIDNLFNEGTKGMNLTDMYKKAEEDECINEDGTCNNPDHLHIGDYVNYKNPSSGTYTVSSEKSGLDRYEYNLNQTYDVSKNQLNWRVLGIDEETGGLKLIAGSPMIKNQDDNNKNSRVIVGNPKLLSFYGANAYVYGVEELNNIGALYKNEYAVEARSVNMEDINEVIGIKSKEDIKKYNIATEEIFLQYDESFSFENNVTPENWLNEKTPTTVSGKVTGYVFEISNEDANVLYQTIKVKNKRAKSMLFDNTEMNTGKAYWIATKSVFAYSSEEKNSKTRSTIPDKTAYYGLNMLSEKNVGVIYTFMSKGDETLLSAAVRPVVILNKNITKNQIQRIPDKTEETWN